MQLAVAGAAAAGIIATVGGATWASAAGDPPAGTHAARAHAAASAGGSTTANVKADVAAEAVAGERAANGGSAPAAHAVTATSRPASHAAPAKLAAQPKPKAVAQPKPKPAGPTKPYLIYDSVTPTAIPQGQHVATYADGPYQASWSDVSGRGDVLWIDVYGNNTGANALDVEPGDATPEVAAAWVRAKLEKDPSSKPIVYTMRSWWPAVTASINGLPGWMHSHVKYWIADPTGYAHVLPGADATQWYWGTSVDITTANPGFWK
jgi:hypothetical protein